MSLTGGESALPGSVALRVRADVSFGFNSSDRQPEGNNARHFVSAHDARAVKITIDASMPTDDTRNITSIEIHIFPVLARRITRACFFVVWLVG